MNKKHQSNTRNIFSYYSFLHFIPHIFSTFAILTLNSLWIQKDHLLKGGLVYSSVLLRLCFLGSCSLTVEAINTSSLRVEVDLTSVERVAVWTSINIDALLGRSNYKWSSASGAGDCSLIIGWVNVFFHKCYILPGIRFQRIP